MKYFIFIHFGVNIYFKPILTEPAHLSNPCKGHRIPTQSHDPQNKRTQQEPLLVTCQKMHDSSVIFLGAWDLEKTSLYFLGDHPLQDVFSPATSLQGNLVPTHSSKVSRGLRVQFPFLYKYLVIFEKTWKDISAYVGSLLVIPFNTFMAPIASP